MEEALAQLAEKIPHLQSSFDSAFVIGSGSFGLTQYILWMIICFLITLAVVLATSKRLTLVPNNKFVNLIEYGYEFIRKDIAEGTIGHGYKRHIPFLATLFFFVFTCNLVGLIPGCKTATGSLSVTWALAVISFGYFVFQGIKMKGLGGYFKSLAPSGLPVVMVPIVWFLELFSTVLRILTLAVRLYGNMFAGHLALGIFAILTTVFIDTAITSGVFATALPAIGWLTLLIILYALELMVAFLQAFVFTILSAVYISLATSADH